MLRRLNIRWLPLLMGLTVFIITGFQVYWLYKSYEREERTLDMRTNYLFRETIFTLQAGKLKLDRLATDSSVQGELQRSGGRPVRVQIQRGQGVSGLVNTISRATDSVRAGVRPFGRRHNRLIQFLYDVDSLQDSVRVHEIHAEYRRRLDEQGLDLDFQVLRLERGESPERVFNEVTLGFTQPLTYRLELGNTVPLLLERQIAPLLFSVFLVGFTLLSFTLLYRNLLRQRRLADIKNEFISNITHELKTPIATVSVAIEALKSYSSRLSPEQSREYLDISAGELQRLSLLVDKVLKLSMFEKRSVELKVEPLDMRDLVQEVMASLRLQFEKLGADVQVGATGDTALEGDRLHLVSVVFNLLDNALKYTPSDRRIRVDVSGSAAGVELRVTDNGVGVPPEYRERIFEKFFRIPTGNQHNAKGYGLGLSYVAHVVAMHGGAIRVEPATGGGSIFIVDLPKQPPHAR